MRRTNVKHIKIAKPASANKAKVALTEERKTHLMEIKKRRGCNPSSQ